MSAKNSRRSRQRKGSTTRSDRKKTDWRSKKLAATTQADLPRNTVFAFGKISEAVYVLATAPGDVRSRLCRAYLPLASVHNHMIPIELRKEFEWVMTMLTRRPPRFPWENRLDASLGTMQNRTGTRVAERIAYIEARFRTILDAACKQG